MTLIIYGLAQIWALFFMYMYSKHKYEINLNSNQQRIFRHKFRFEKSKVFCLLSGLPLFLLIVLRSRDVGKDYNTYVEAIIKISNGDLASYYNDWLGQGFFYLVKILNRVGFQNSALVLAVVSIVGFFSLYFLYKAILDNSDYPTVSLYIFMSFCLYYQMFNQFRQMLAIVITTFAYKYIKNDKPIKYMLIILCAVSIHNSAIVMLPAYFLCRFNICRKNLYMYLFLAIVSYIGFDAIINILQYTNYGRTYLDWNLYNVANKLSTIINFIIRVILLIVCLALYKRIIKKDEKSKGLYNCVIICTIMQLLTMKFYIFGRITTYYFMFYIFLIPKVLEEIGIIFNNKKFIYLMFIYVMLAYHYVYYFTIGSEGGGYEVYKFFFN